MRRCIDAHIITLQTLHNLYHETFFEKYSDVVDRLTAAAEILKDACHGSGDVHQAQEKMMQEMQSLNIQAKMHQFELNGYLVNLDNSFQLSITFYQIPLYVRSPWQAKTKFTIFGHQRSFNTI